MPSGPDVAYGLNMIGEGNIIRYADPIFFLVIVLSSFLSGSIVQLLFVGLPALLRVCQYGPKVQVHCTYHQV